MLRTHKCDELSSKNIGEEVTLSGWVSNRRDHGGIIFIDLRDRYGLTQIVFDPEDNKKAWEIADTFRSEFVIKATGKVRARPEGQANPNMKTGEIEVIIDKEVEILSKSKTPPFELDGHGELANEEIRYKHRYIDLRRAAALENIKFRSKFIHFTKNWFIERDFLDVQTPIFTVSSPEGARDYLIPSRLNPGKFYALPQAPQQYKQLLMVGGIDKYFQIAPCFRDEDPRADRHSCEFYQIDCEMSFVEQEDIFKVVEEYFFDLIENLSEKTILDKKFYRMSFDEAMELYGSDKPDLRYDLKMVDVASIFARSTNEIFSSIASDTKSNRIKALRVPSGDEYFSKSQMKTFEKFVRQHGAAGLGYFQMTEEGLKGPLNKFFSEADLQEIINVTNLKIGDVVFFGAGEKRVVQNYMGKFRIHLAGLIDEITKGKFIDKNILAFSWITDFPMFEENEITGKIDFGHNPFSMPKGGLKAFEKDNLLEVESVQYDLACNGFEVLSGSIRNHDIEALVKAFEKVGRTEEEVKEKFGAMYEAFSYGVPPHGGFAIGMDRIIMILKNEENIREIYAFPKSGKAQDIMMNAPAVIDEDQLEELHIEVVDEEK
ncbi:aspartate--tRNA ligase [Candidatus Gracilibacteria bacterium]|nr:MAG: aspartate--tRNA ligase [Candidatus Gracilibacteria bacterium]PIE85423.1 MAG: aspartate--tRNA ligase [Candidatus Gracilibacteria bacterium]